ncbi:MAG TPA: lysylphosphatidylglycerol synthase transmembrane domain-containing protein [Polyangiaceae bacterium]
MTSERPRFATRRTAGVLASAAVLGVTLAYIGPTDVLARLAHLSPLWLTAGLALSSAHFVLLGLRWAHWARALGVPLSLSAALREYYLSALLNQVLPFGVLGDGLRALRHVQSARASAGGAEPRLKTRVVLALLCDRIGGQLALWTLALATLPLWLSWPALAFKPPLFAVSLAIVLASLALYAVLARSRWVTEVRAELGPLLRRLLAPRELVLHAGLSLTSVLLLIAVFCCCAGAARADLSPLRALCLVPWILIAASVPGFFGGWGIRELTAVGVYALAGLDVEAAASISVVYGMLSLLSSLPGVLLLRGVRIPKADPARS